MFHFAKPVQDWPRAAAMLPAGYAIKAIDNVQMLAEVKAINPGLKTILRHHYDGKQTPAATDAENEQLAREFFETFIDGTFRDGVTHGWNHASATDYIEGWNEFFGNTQNDEERARFVSWVRAAAKIWATEYRPQDGLGHIRLIIANTAIGNDIPLEAARAAVQYGAVLGYHCYWPTRNNLVPPDEWRWYSGRWTELDKQYKAAGLTVRWAFTEAGAIGYGGTWPTIGLKPLDGWKLASVHGGNIEEYLASITRWMNLWHSWNKANGHRALPPVLFTSGGSSEWKHFELQQPNLDVIANYVRNWQPEEPPPPPPPEPECRGKPRAQYNRVTFVIPMHYSAEQAASVFEAATAQKRSVGWSYDDAGIGDLDSRTARLYGIPDGDQQGFINWYNTNYPGVKVEFANVPSEEIPAIENITDDLPKHATLTYKTRQTSSITALTIHHTVSPPSRAIEDIARYHISADPRRNKSAWPGIGYHFVIKDTGKIYQTNYLTTISYHAGSAAAPGDENAWSVGIALQGDFTNEPPPQAQLDAARDLVAYLKELLGISDVFRHRDMPGASTACPGATSPKWIGYVKGE